MTDFEEGVLFGFIIALAPYLGARLAWWATRPTELPMDERGWVWRDDVA